jgi:hypothetical protein
MNVKKALLATGATTIVGLASFAGVAAAATSGTSGQDTLVGKIATKFHLDKGEVQAVFDEDRSEHEAKHAQKMEERLTQAVNDGKITAAQKDQIVAKHKEVKTYMESIKDKPIAERHELMKAKMDEVKQWAEDNGLSGYFPRMHVMRADGPGMKEVHIEGDGDMAPPVMGAVEDPEQE